MEVIAAIGAWALTAFSSSPESFSGFSLLAPKADIIAELGPFLSSNASIFLPGSRQFANATTRWQMYQDPNITVVVEVATESDVQETVSDSSDSYVLD